MVEERKPSINSIPIASPHNQLASPGRRSVYSYSMNDVRILATQNIALYKKIEAEYYQNILYDIMFEISIDVSTQY
jgi:hypothetical protein